MLYFEALSGERPLETLLHDVVDSLPAVCSDIDKSVEVGKVICVKWWTKPAHLSMSCNIDCLVYMCST